jgi:hypothetical protein
LNRCAETLSGKSYKNMLTLEELKKTLPNPEKYSDEELEKINNLLDRLADVLFEMWLKKLNQKL